MHVFVLLVPFYNAPDPHVCEAFPIPLAFHFGKHKRNKWENERSNNNVEAGSAVGSNFFNLMVLVGPPPPTAPTAPFPTPLVISSV